MGVSLAFPPMLLLLLVLLTSSISSIHSSDLEVLHKFKQQLLDPSDSLASWSLDSPCSSWEGVSCLNDGVTVIQLLLYNKSLTGPISPSLAKLTSLQVLDLSENSFTGHIPEGLLTLGNLTMLSLSGNRLSGEIPRFISGLQSLEYLYLSRNNLSGSIPGELGGCRRLKELDFSQNQLQGPVPVPLASLRSLEKLALAMNNLSGHIPDFGNCTNLTDLALSYNSFTGVLHPSVGMLPRLQNLWLNDNQLGGELPVELGRHSKVLVLYLSRNHFTGTIPEDLCKDGLLERLYLHDNNLQGKIPIQLTKCPRLERLLLQNNNLTGEIPEVGQDQALTYLDVSNNQLNGSLPVSLNQSKNLRALLLGGNQLSGELTSGFHQLHKLNLSSNKFTGQIPQNFGGSGLFLLDLSHNNLRGNVPSDIQRLKGLQELILSGNQLEGAIPGVFGDLHKLLNLVLEHNGFSGRIPSELGDLNSLTHLDLSNNRFSGTIPEQLSNLRMLDELDLSVNDLQGNIPSQLEQLTSLEHLNLSYNPLLLGNIPSAWTNKFDASSFLGLVVQNSSCTRNCEHENKKQLSKAGKAGIAFGALASCIVLASIVACWIAKHRIRQRATDGTLEKIMQATNGLSQAFVIGQGGYGTVYRAEIESGQVLAVKKLSIGAESSESFIREWETAGKIRHRNVLQILSHHRYGDSALLVSRFMKNGSLGSLLHSDHKVNIPWKLRYEIAIGIAHGLSYLHHDCVPKIIHRDIKANNVLLDDDMVPKIADFGLAKLIDETGSMSYIAGSYGYIAPEYAHTLRVDEKSDVYSFGVILLELLLRRPPLDPLFSEAEGSMPMWVRIETGGLRSGLERVVDAKMWDAAEPEPIEKKEMEKFFHAALLCTENDPARRPGMQQVVQMLARTLNPLR